jgi:hypothetical protein
MMSLETLTIIIGLLAIAQPWVLRWLEKRKG